jgi:hypothetical protein
MQQYFIVHTIRIMITPNRVTLTWLYANGALYYLQSRPGHIFVAVLQTMTSEASNRRTIILIYSTHLSPC